MNRHILLLTIAALILAIGCQRVELPANNDFDQPFFEREYVPGVLNIKVSENIAEKIEKEGTFELLPGSKAVRLFPDGGKFEERMRREGLHQWYKVTFDESTQLTRAENSLLSAEGVELVEFRPRIALESESDFFNDPYYSYQWHYFNAGNAKTGQIAGCDINVVPAWERGIVGSDKVIVAVIDSGVDYNHEDLRDNMWTNPETLPKITYGYNFDANTDFVTPGDHGTHVGGTIAAVNNNGIGLCGIAGGDAAKGIKGVRLMSCQIFSTLINGDGDFEGAIVWAANHGAVIAQNSWGVIKEVAISMTDTPSSSKAAIDYFNRYAGCDNDGNQLPDSPMKGGVVIFAAGNDSMAKGFPAMYEGCVAVGALSGDFTPASYTNFGDWVDICAPGGDNSQVIASTMPDNNYGTATGTSMACPHVSGVAALIISEFGGPGFTREECIDRLLKTTTPVNTGSLPLGRGIVNAADAVAHYGEYLPNNVEYTGYDAQSATALKLNFKVPEMNNDVRCRIVKVYVSKNKFTYPTDDCMTITKDLSTFKVGTEFSILVKNLEADTGYYFSTIGVDAFGNESALSVNIPVTTQVNNPPVIKPVNGDDLTMKRFMTRSLDFYITDPDENLADVRYIAAGTADSMKKDEYGLYSVTIKGPGFEPGRYSSTIVATDDFGEKTECVIHFTIDQNLAPSLDAPVPDRIIIGSGQSIEVDFRKYFTHPDGDDISFSAEVSDESVISTTIMNASQKMIIRSNSFGYSNIKVIATDSFGLTAQCTFRVAAMAGNGYEVYPNPVTDGRMYVRSSQESSYDLSVVNSVGAVVRTVTVSNDPFSPYCMDVSDLSAGRYTVKIKGKTAESSHSIVIF